MAAFDLNKEQNNMLLAINTKWGTEKEFYGIDAIKLVSKEYLEWFEQELKKKGITYAIEVEVTATLELLESLRKEGLLNKRVIKNEYGDEKYYYTLLDKPPDIPAKKDERMGEVVRGGAGEPYCSKKCYDDGGRYGFAVRSQNQTGICGFCKRPVQASMPKPGGSICVVIPYEGKTLFICENCRDTGRAYLENYNKCCMCQKPLTESKPSDSSVVQPSSKKQWWRFWKS